MAAKPSAKSPEALWAELEALPDGVRGEIIDGVLYTQAQPLPRHQSIATAVAGDVLNAYQRGRGGPGGWIILAEPGVRVQPFAEFAPDVAGWRKERLPRIPDAAITLAPDWICEVQSKSTRTHDLETKRAFYARIGVEWLWYVDPKPRTLLVSRLERGRWVEMGMWTGRHTVNAPPFEAVTLDLAEWWDDEEDAH